MTTTIDTRSRRRSQARSLSVDESIDVLADAVERHGGLAAEGVAAGALPPLRIEAGDRAVTLHADGPAFSIAARAEPATTIRVTEEGLSNLVQDVQTPMGLAMTSRAETVAGDFEHWLRWEPTFHALLDGRPVHRAGSVTMLDDDGAPIDLGRSFRLDDDPRAAGRFLVEAGFLHVRDVFTADEMAAVSHDLERCLAESTPDDGESWWATDADGTDLPVRVLWFHERSDALAALLDDDRIRWFGRLTDDDLAMDDLGAEGLVKPLHIERGLSDLPWHKDCGQGLHAYNCSGLTLGISVTGADRTSGALGVIPGSHRANTQSSLRAHDLDLEPRMLETATGDVTVHCSDTLHRAHPPVDRPREVVYSGIPLRPLPGDDDGDWWKPSRDEARRRRADLSSVEGRIGSARG